MTEHFSLIINALQAKREANPLVTEFRNILANDYMPFAREENSLPNEADMVEKLQGVCTDLERILNFPVLHSKNVCAVGGGFSSGKSTFINTFFKVDTVQLAEDINPSTALPSYVVCADTAKVIGYNTAGASFEISNEVYETINHETMKNINFDFRLIIPYITVCCPMDKNLFEHICLIDTPGYNAPSAGAAEKDSAIAATSIENAHFLIWLIGLDQTGTIQKSDIDFLNQKSLKFGKKQTDSRDLYIVLNNKNNQRSKEDLHKILDSCDKMLVNSGLEYAGMCAFDPCDQKRSVYEYRKKDFFEFLREKNKPNVNIDILYRAVHSVLASYRGFLSDDVKHFENLQKSIKNLKNTVYLNLKTANTDRVDSGFEELENLVKNRKALKNPQENLEKLKKVSTKFNDWFFKISRALGDNEWHPFPVYCNCGRELEKSWGGCCPQCGPVEL